MHKEVKVRIVRSDNKEFLLNSNDWKIPSNGLEGFGMFENDITVTANAVGDGGVISSDRLAEKDRTIVAKSRNPLLNDVLRRHAISFFSPKYDYKVYVTYMSETRWCEGKIYKFSLPSENVYRNMTLSVTFLCPSPYLKSYEDFGKNIAMVTPMIGFPYLCASNVGITGGRFNFAKQVFLDNDGDVDAFCKAIIKATGEVTNPALHIDEGYVRIIDNMMEGDVIEIDFTKLPPTVKKNGANCIGRCDRTSTFDEMALKVGGSNVSYSADDGDINLEVSIYYNKLYAAI